MQVFCIYGGILRRDILGPKHEGSVTPGCVPEELERDETQQLYAAQALNLANDFAFNVKQTFQGNKSDFVIYPYFNIGDPNAMGVNEQGFAPDEKNIRPEDR